jgi:hypothetical protein
MSLKYFHALFYIVIRIYGIDFKMLIVYNEFILNEERR